MKRHSSAKRAVTEWFKEFCLVTAQHGFKYLAFPGQSALERLMWLVVLVLAALTAVSMMWEAWLRSRANPTLTAIESVHYPIWNIPFPAVSLCSTNMVDRASAHKLSKSMKLPPGHSVQEAFLNFQLLNQLILPSKDHKENLTRLQELLDFNNLTIETLARKVMPPCDRLLVKCSFKGDVNCLSMVKAVKTAYGYCCGFNYHGTHQKKYGSGNSGGVGSRHFRISSCGPATGLVVVIDNMSHHYFSTTLASNGVKVLVHNPHDFPGESTEERLLPSGSKMLISVYPVSTCSTSSALDMDVSERRCYTHEEGRAQHKHSYSFANCFTQCQNNVSVRLCGCSSFFYPRSENHRICRMTDIPCLADKMRQIQAASDEAGGSVTSESPACGCMPECDQLRYELESSQSVLIVNTSVAATDALGAKLSKDHSIVHVYFIDMVGTRYRRDVLRTWHSMLASFGGLLGIFLGFSMLTGFEAVYFFTARVFFHWLRATPSYVSRPPATPVTPHPPRRRLEEAPRGHLTSQLTAARQLMVPRGDDQSLDGRHFSLGPPSRDRAS